MNATCGIVSFACLAAGVAQAGGVDAPFGAEGLAGLSWNGQALLADGASTVTGVMLDTTPTTAGVGQPSFAPAPLEPLQVHVDAAARTRTLSYPWGSVAFAFTPGADRLVVDATVRNAGTQPIAGFTLQPLALCFPAVPDGWEKPSAHVERSLDNVVAVRAAYEGKQVLACLDTLDPPTALGFGKPADPEHLTYPVEWNANVPCPDPKLAVFHPLGMARVEPGQQRSFRLSLRFASADRPRAAIVADLLEGFRALHPPLNDWPDRRPIGMLMFQGGGQHKSPTNPRGWFQKPNLDVTSAEGKAEFRKSVMEWGARAVAALKAFDAQGGMFWNLEGEENPHPITYIGDPRMLPVLAPEMDAVADDLFRLFTNAGLRVGVTLRPTQLYHDAAKGKWAHGTGSHGPERNPLKDDFAAIWPNGVPWHRFYPVAERLCRKIDYAKKRWGCTIFYIDTNGLFVQQGAEQKFEWMLLTGTILRAVKERHPDVLLIPELAGGDGGTHVTNWGYAAQYQELDLKGYGTPAWVREVYPSAYSVVNIADGPIEEQRARLVEAVRGGDILMSRGWFGDHRNAIVKGIYEEARGMQ